VRDAMRDDLEAPRHPADGGGSAWLEGAPESVTVSAPGVWRVIYEAGPLGIAEGGAVYLQTSPYWGWSPPQIRSPQMQGYTEVGTEAEGVALAPIAHPGGLLQVDIGGRALVAGERIAFTYGAGVGARGDRFAEAEERLFVAVDGDGDGVRELLGESPAVTTVAGAPAHLVLTAPTTARPGEEVPLTIAALDAMGNAGVAGAGVVLLAAPGLPVPAEITLPASGHTTLWIAVPDAGIFRVQGCTTEGLCGEAGPLVVAAQTPRIRWADLHGHSNLSDGTGTPEDYFTYARQVAALDVVSLTDHDHWGMRFLDQHPELWDRIQRATAAAHEPGRFVTVPGYEWTSWIHGHRHVLYFTADAAVHSSLSAESDTPAELWDRLRGQDAMTLAHHTAGEPVPTDWSVPPDPILEPLVEVASVHGSSESADTVRPVRGGTDGFWIRDALDRGYRLGMIGSGDSHDGHPGLAHLASGSGGLAAVFAEDLTRDGVLSALRARRAYATNGPRILLRFSVDDQPMGAVISPVDSATVSIRVVSPGIVQQVDLIRSGQIVQTLTGDGDRGLVATADVQSLHAGEYLYVRVVQTDGGAAWSSPVFVE